MAPQASSGTANFTAFASSEDVAFMRLAIEEAKKAFERGEVPVGAVIVCDGKVIAKAHNMRESLKSPLAHAELLAMEAAANALGDWRLNKATLYVTLEPCPMCAGAMIQARLGRLVFGAYDEKAGAAGSVIDLFGLSAFDGIVAVVGGVLSEECANLLRQFFEQRR